MIIIALGLVAVGAIAGFVAGVFVYRNNEELIDPVASGIDDTWDKYEVEIDQLKEQLEDKDSLVRKLLSKLTQMEASQQASAEMVKAPVEEPVAKTTKRRTKK